MSRKNQAAQAAAEAVEVEVIETVEAAEPTRPEGVESIEADETAPADPKPQDEAFVVVWHVKAGGKRYEPGESIAPELAQPFLASGAVAKA